MFFAVPRMSRLLRTVAVANPAQLGQLGKAVGRVDLELLGVRVAQALGRPLALVAWEQRPLGEEVLAGALQVLERLLQGMHGRVLEPRRLDAVVKYFDGLGIPRLA